MTLIESYPQMSIFKGRKGRLIARQLENLV